MGFGTTVLLTYLFLFLALFLSPLNNGGEISSKKEDLFTLVPALAFGQDSDKFIYSKSHGFRLGLSVRRKDIGFLGLPVG